MLANPKFDQKEAINMAEMFRLNNLVQSKYISSLSSLDMRISNPYSWSELIKKYPQVNNCETIDRWVIHFSKSKKNDKSEEFLNHCRILKSEGIAKKNMTKSVREIHINNQICEIINGDCALLNGVCESKEFRLLFFF